MHVLTRSWHAARDEPGRGVARLPRPSPGSAGPALPPPPRRDRAAAGGAGRRLDLSTSTSTRSSPIIREEEQPKPRLMARFRLTDVQAEAIQTCACAACASWRKWRSAGSISRLTEDKGPQGAAEQREAALDADHRRATRTYPRDIRAGPLGERRTEIGDAAGGYEIACEGLVEREPITVILSEKGWLRAIRGAVADPAERDSRRATACASCCRARTTDRLSLLATNGTRLYAESRRPAARSRRRPAGAPAARNDNDDEIVALFVLLEGDAYLIASNTGRGFVSRRGSR